MEKVLTEVTLYCALALDCHLTCVPHRHGPAGNIYLSSTLVTWLIFYLFFFLPAFSDA